jgi:uncharacterized OB-fold protein
VTDAAAALPLFRSGAFERSSEGPRLLGTRCRLCGQVFHARVSICFECLRSDLEVVPLARSGTLECFTTVHMPAERIAPPYTVGYVKLPEGLRIFAPIDAAVDALAVGMPMRLAEFVLGAERPEALAYCFVPDGGTHPS